MTRTNAGALDCVFTPSGTLGYDDLATRAVEYELRGVRIKIAAAHDLMRIARTTDTPIARAQLEILAAVKEERERQN